MSYIECTSRLTVYVWAPELSSLYSEMHEACSGTFFEVHSSLIWFRSLCRGCRACQPLWWSDRPPLSSSPAPAVRRLNASLHAHWRPHYGAERSGISCAPTLQVTGRRGTGVRMKRVHNYVENKNYLVSPIPQPHPKELYLVGRQGNGAIEIKMVVFFFLFLGNRALIAICATSSWASVIGQGLLLIWWLLAEAFRDRKWQRGSHSPTLGEMWGTIHTPTAASGKQRLCFCACGGQALSAPIPVHLSVLLRLQNAGVTLRNISI